MLCGCACRYQFGCSMEQVVDVTCSDTPGGTTVSHGCGHLLQTLIDLVAPPWVSS